MQTRISIIAAMSENRVIGIDNRLPWYLPEDWDNFRRVTRGKAFIMGRTSYESEEALVSDYRNIILTSHKALALCSNCETAGSIEEALARLAGEEEIFILGGDQVFRQTLHLADYLYLTIVHHTFEGDAFFPQINWTEWQLVKSTHHKADDRHQYAFSLNEYKRLY